MKVPSRTLFLIGAATAAGALVALDQRGVEQTASSIGAPHAGLKVDPQRSQEIRTRPLISAAVRDPFTPVPTPSPQPLVPEVQVEVAAPPPPPTAPPLPFRYFGRIKGTNGKSAEFVERDNQLVAVEAGDVLDDAYRVERVEENEIVFLHLATQQRQSLSVTPP